MLNRILIFALLMLSPLKGNASSQESPDSSISRAPGNYALIKPRESGDDQHQKVNNRLDDPVRVMLVDEDSRPVAGYPVQFLVISEPEKSEGFSILSEQAITDSAGIAGTEVILGSKEGEYQIAARIRGSMDHDMQVYTFQARKKNWLFMLIIGLLGGMGLFLLGMDMMSEGMKKSAGDKMRSILGNLTSNRLLAVGLGTFVTMIMQSSSATSVMLVGFVNSKLMKFRRTIGIILGANIGTTFTVQLIAFKLTDYSLLMIALGLMMLYLSNKQRYKYVGQAILGFGILFFGMHIMSEAMVPLRSHAPFIELLLRLEDPLLGLLVGIVFTAILQSSGAFIGINIVLAAQGLLTLEAAIPMLLGSNIGTAITAFLASIKASREAKKVAVANALINIFGMLLVIWWIPGYADIVEYISPKSALPFDDPLAMAEMVPRQIANAHTLFNVMIACILTPVTGPVARFIDFLLPEKEAPEEAMMKTHYLDDNLISTPSLALNLAKQEALRIGTITQDMVGDVILPFLVKQPHVLADLVSKEKQVDFLVNEENAYLMKIIRQSITEARADEAFQIMYTVKELEEIADIIGNLMVTRAEVWITSDAEFSDQGKKELLEYHTMTQKQLSRALEVFRDVNLEKARRMRSKYRKYRSIASEMEKQHYERLRDSGKKIETTGDTHMEVMTRLRTITHHSTNIARILIEWKTGENRVN
jgi:phosphate:Na+ symporter